MFVSIGQILFLFSIFAYGLSPNLAACSWRAGGAGRPRIGQHKALLTKWEAALLRQPGEAEHWKMKCHMT